MFRHFPSCQFSLSRIKGNPDFIKLSIIRRECKSIVFTVDLFYCCIRQLRNPYVTSSFGKDNVYLCRLLS